MRSLHSVRLVVLGATTTMMIMGGGGIHAFCPEMRRVSSPPRMNTALGVETTPKAPAPVIVPYGEESRKYRRTVYTHDDWVKHRSPDRFLQNLASTTSSGVYKNVGREIVYIAIMAVAVWAWNAFVSPVGGYEDLSSVRHDGSLLLPQVPQVPLLGLPLTPFTLSSPSLGLLLVFRTNKAYQRWDEARKNWGMNINHTRDLVRLGTAFYGTHAGATSTTTDPQRRTQDLKRLALCTWAFVRAMKRHLSPPAEDEEDFREELRAKLPPAVSDKIEQATHRPNAALQELSVAIEGLQTDAWRKNEIHKAATIFADTLGSSERLLSSPVPLFYSRHTGRFLYVWLLLLPLALWEPFQTTWNHVGMVPATVVISLFLFGIEELATQMEEPFTILPMQGFCNKIYDNCNEIVSWASEDDSSKEEEERDAKPVYSYNHNIF